MNFARGGGSTRSFDFEVDTKNGVVHTFSSIEKEEYNRLYDFINSKKLRVKNTGRSVIYSYLFKCFVSQIIYISFHLKEKSSHADDFGDSDEEEAPDAYLARVKAEGKERDAIGNSNTSFVCSRLLEDVASTLLDTILNHLITDLPCFLL